MPYNTQRRIFWKGNVEPDMSHYRVWRGLASNQYSDWIETTGLAGIGSTDRPGLIYPGLENNTQYFFAITAWDINGNESSPSAEVTATPIVPLTRVVRRIH
jgi:hypothetical protein